RVADGTLRTGGEHFLGQLLLALLAHRFDEQRVLVAEVAVDGELGHAGIGGNLVHAHAIEAVQREQALGGVEDGGALFRILRPAGSLRAGRGGRSNGFGGGSGGGGRAGSCHHAVVDNSSTVEFNIFSVLVRSLSHAMCSAPLPVPARN